MPTATIGGSAIITIGGLLIKGRKMFIRIILLVALFFPVQVLSLTVNTDKCTCENWTQFSTPAYREGSGKGKLACVRDQKVWPGMLVRWTAKEGGTCWICEPEYVQCPTPSGGQSGKSYTCKRGGELSGIGGDGKPYSANWSGYGVLETIPYRYKNTPFFHFKLNGKPWPNSAWGVSASSWKIQCN